MPGGLPRPKTPSERKKEKNDAKRAAKQAKKEKRITLRSEKDKAKKEKQTTIQKQKQEQAEKKARGQFITHYYQNVATSGFEMCFLSALWDPDVAPFWDPGVATKMCRCVSTPADRSYKHILFVLVF